MEPMRCALLLLSATTSFAHDMNSAVTWSREVSRLVNRHCASCHSDTGKAFPLTTFQQAHDRAPAIARAVLERRMPPFGAVKGFGDLRDDSSLTQEQIELFVKWAQAGATEGDASLHPQPSPPIPASAPNAATGTEWQVNGTRTLEQPMSFAAIVARSIPAGASVRIVAQKPDGIVAPLVWFYQYDPKNSHTWFFRKTISLPAGTKIVASTADGVAFSLYTPARR